MSASEAVVMGAYYISGHTTSVSVLMTWKIIDEVCVINSLGERDLEEVVESVTRGDQ